MWSDASAPDKPGRDALADRRQGQQTRTARTAEATTIGKDGIVVKDGGNITVKDGGRISAEYPSGRPAVFFGPQVLEGTDTPDGHGLLVQADDDTQGRDVFRAKYENGQRLVFIGQTPGDDAAGAVDRFVTDSVVIGLHSHGNELRLQTHDGGDLLQFVNGDLRMVVDATWDANVTGNLDFDVQGTALIQSNTTMQLLCEGQAGLGGTTGTFLQPASGSGTANMRMDTSTGQVTYVTSTERVKTDIQDLEADPAAVLQLRPRTWLPGPTTRQCPEWMHAQHPEGECHAGELVDPPPDAVREVGFVAEELDALGLVDFVEYGVEDGLPVSIRYDRMTAALVPVVQQQAQQITELQGALAALTERVAALEPAPPVEEA